jgi:5-methylcytosine-specific restriction enzyme subunit McrC
MPLFIREYGHLLREQSLSSQEDKAISVPAADFDYLESRLCAHYDDSNVGNLFLKPSLFKGRRSLQVQSSVGVLQTPSGTQIEILPKIYSNHGQELGPNQVRNILVRMLGYLRNSPFKQNDHALMADVSIPLIEVFISYFLEQVNKLVKRGIRSDFVSTQNNIGFVKGKLLVADQIRQNLVHRHRFFVEYDEFQLNRPENRLIRSTLEKVNNIVSKSSNQRLCRELLFAFNSVPIAANIRTDLALCSKDRSMVYYEQVLAWCRIILLDQSPIGSAGDTRSISLLFPMERIFEDYVAARMRQLHPDWQIKTQARDHYLMQHEGKNIYLLKPDLVLKRGKSRVVADTKWKLLGQDNSKPIQNSIGQADLYQMFAYGKKYLHDQEMKEVYLIFPKSERFTKPLPAFEYDDGFRLFVVPFDLSLDVDRLLFGGEGYLAS